MYSFDVSMLDTGCPIEPVTTLISLGWNRLASKDPLIESG